MKSDWIKSWFAGVSSDHLEAIGQVAVCSAMVESTIRAVIWKYASVDPQIGRCFTGGARIGDLLLTIEAIVGQTQSNKSLISDVNNICIEIKGLFVERARVIHRVWGMGANGPQTSKFLLTRDATKEAAEELHFGVCS